MALLIDRNAPGSGLASLQAMQGRYGDTELVHMSKPEVQGLASLGQLTVNPVTGLPEAFSLKSLLPAIGGIAATAFLGPAAAGLFTGANAGLLGGALAGGLGTAAGGLLAGQKPGQALLSGVLGGAMSYGLGSLMAAPGLEAGGTEALSFAGPEAAASPQAAFDVVDEGFMAGAIPSGQTSLSSGMISPRLPANFSYQSGSPFVEPLGGTVFGGGNTQATSLLSPQSPPPPSTFPTGTANIQTSPYTLTKDFKPNAIQKMMGMEATSAGDLTREQFTKLGGVPTDITPIEALKKPTTYAPLAAAAMTAEETEEVKQPEGSVEFPEYKFTSTRRRTEPRTQAEILQDALKGRKPEDARFFDTKFTTLPSTFRDKESGEIIDPNAPVAKKPVDYNEDGEPVDEFGNVIYVNQGGLIGLAMGGMPMMPQQPPMQPDITQQFVTMKDAQENAIDQNRASSLAGLASGVMQGSQMMPMNEGGQPFFEGQVQGPGDGQSDQVAFRVAGGNVDGAMLSPDEYVLAADVVSAIGNGSSDAGAAKLDQFMKNVRQDAYGTTQQMKPFDNQGLQTLVA